MGSTPRHTAITATPDQSPPTVDTTEVELVDGADAQELRTARRELTDDQLVEREESRRHRVQSSLGQRLSASKLDGGLEMVLWLERAGIPTADATRSKS